MTQVYIAVGSNLSPESNILSAVTQLMRHVEITKVSTFYRTEPIGLNDSPPFYNGILEAVTDLPPLQLKFSVLRRIEEELGRKRTGDKYTSRTIDLDIIVYDDVVVNEPDLLIPDPDVMSRPFVAIPLAELAPELIIPGERKRITEIVEDMQDQRMDRLDDFTRLLREVIEENEP